MRRNKYKEIGIGFLVGLIANALGILLWWLFFAYPTDLVTMLTMAYEQEVLGTIIGLGAILNLVAFFGFIRLRHDLRARGVLIATFLSAFCNSCTEVFVRDQNNRSCRREQGTHAANQTAPTQ